MKRVVALMLILLFIPSACAWAEGFVLPHDALSAIVIDGYTGEVLLEINADTRVYPASTTKILTVFLGFLLEDTERVVTISSAAVRLPSDAVRIGLKAGEEVRLYDLLAATLVKSGNDGANAVAEAVAGDSKAFAQLMNSYAIGIGCTDTHFTNPSGLHDEEHYTTARDMAKIAFEAMQHEEFCAIAGIGRYTLPETNLSAARTLSSHGRAFFDNPQSDYYFAGANGLKTGYHEAAGYCFVATAERNEQLLIAAVFGCESYGACFRNAAALLEYGFEKK